MAINCYASPGEALTDSLRYVTVNAKDTYHFHGFAGQQIAGDPNFFDMSGNKHDGVFGANLPNATAWANPGYVTTLNPAAGALDSVIRLPGIDYDYNGGEKLFLWWLGRVTAEGASVSMLGDGGVSASFPGVRIRVNTNGTTQLSLISPTGTGFSGSSAVVADGNLRCVAWALDGSAQRFGVWVDTVYAPFLSGSYGNFNPGQSFDTRNSNSFQIGGSSPKAANSSDGVPTQTRAFVLLKLGPDDPMPTVSQLTTLVQALRRDPGKLVLDSAF
jgi:hypothetical protein